VTVGARRSRLVCRDSFRDNSAVAQDLKSALREFVRFAQTLRGDEKSEAQTFLDHFFRARSGMKGRSKQA